MSSSTFDQAALLRIVEQKKARALDERALSTLFLQARTARAFLDHPVPRELLEKIVEIAELGPTSANGSPMRVVFVESQEAKERLRPTLNAGNVEKTMKAPVTAIIAMDLVFYEHLPKLYPHADMRSSFIGEDKIEYTRRSVMINASLQGAYFMLAARALGLDAGPMIGFDNAKVDREFFAGTNWESLWLVNLGYGDDTKLHARDPRLTFEEVVKIL